MASGTGSQDKTTGKKIKIICDVGGDPDYSSRKAICRSQVRFDSCNDIIAKQF
jgi:ribosomal protein L37E